MIRKMMIVIVGVFGLGLHAQALPNNDKALKAIHVLDHHQKQFSFVVMGDNRGGYNVLEKILADIDKDPNVLFGIDGGDLTSMGYAKQYRHYLATLAQTSKPILSVIGNHEIPWYDGETNYEHYMGQPYYAFTLGNSAFIVLDDANEKNLGAQQKAWLIAQLKRTQKYAHRFIFMHVPLYDPRKGEYAKGHSLKKRKVARELNDLFDRYHVTMVFASHIHFYFRGHWHQTPFIITGGGGAPLKHYKNDGFYHYIKVTVNGNKVNYHVVHIHAPEPGYWDSLLRDSMESLGLE